MGEIKQTRKPCLVLAEPRSRASLNLPVVGEVNTTLCRQPTLGFKDHFLC